MLLVLPFHSNDAKLALAQAKYLELVGPYKSHDLLIVAPNTCEDTASQILLAIGDQFAKTSTYFLTNHRDGWPIGPNMMFHSTMTHIWQNVDCECWYFYEPDNTPLKPNWINTLYDEYRRVQRPFLGFIHPTHWRRANGEVYDDGVHMTGSSIYPKNAPKYSILYKTIPHANIAFDVYWQWDIIKYAAHTSLIHHEWRSWKYRLDKETGVIQGERTPDGKVIPEAIKPLSVSAVTHHGCKDGSLMKIMRGLLGSRKESVEEPVQETLPV